MGYSRPDTHRTVTTDGVRVDFHFGVVVTTYPPAPEKPGGGGRRETVTVLQVGIPVGVHLRLLGSADRPEVRVIGDHV